MQHIDKSKQSRTTLPGVLVALGIIFGDIGTSPLYTFNAIIGEHQVSAPLILGGLSAIFWTLTFQTTIKYVMLTLDADNHGEGGIFSLYALVRRRAKWLYIPAVIGGSTLLADSLITPSISVSSAVEGLRYFDPEIKTIPIVVAIITILFFVQQFGTNRVGRIFGPVMLLWFSMLGVFGILSLLGNLSVLSALNPKYAIDLIVYHPEGLWVLGAVFLCTTGAEALYSDLGHCGKKNIRISWTFVKIMLLINYFGQGAWLLSRNGQTLGGANPFFSIVPEGLLIPSLLLTTLAVIVASQALISGAFTLINEAIRLNFWPKIRLIHPTERQGQIYIPGVNWLLWAGCLGVVFYFQKSSNMEAAYGLSIIVTMLMTSVLLWVYLYYKKKNLLVLVGFIIVYGSIESLFLAANLGKLFHGGWVTVVIALVLIFIMLVCYHARKIRNRYLQFDKLATYIEPILRLSADNEVPKLCCHLVYLTVANRPTDVEHKVIYSLFEKQPKKADTYWFIHVDVQDQPYTMEYKVSILEADKVYRVDLYLGFRIEPRLNLMFKSILEDLYKSGEVHYVNKYSFSKNKLTPGDFRFVVLENFLSYEQPLPITEQWIISFYLFLKGIGLTEAKAFGLDANSVVIEKIPLSVSTSKIQLKRV
ncbi:MAG: KUP/HAK/KT family potassium transporter [Imperialibacter sp.]|uniref:KUP/HAK/KT family potassium transporter n=1 Tax=Imperialibacter sp. TaxID=2038411 RepID=UPI0032EAA80A